MKGEVFLSMQAEVGSIVTGKVTGVTAFGAFILLDDGRTGLVHISEVADGYVKDLNQYLSEGQIVKVKIISIDERNGKLKLSIKQSGQKIVTPENTHRAEEQDAVSKACFEDRLAKFLKDSNEKMQDLKKNVEAKRGGGYRKASQL